jgi:hypothetical protein
LTSKRACFCQKKSPAAAGLRRRDEKEVVNYLFSKAVYGGVAKKVSASIWQAVSSA